MNPTQACIRVHNWVLNVDDRRHRGGHGRSPSALLSGNQVLGMAKSNTTDAKALIRSLRSAYAATPISLKIIDLYVVYAITTAVIQVVYMGIVGSFPFNSFLSGVLSCVGTAVLAVCLRIQVNKENKEFKDLPPERAFADFVLCNLVLHLVIMNFLG
ncbi:hypothetical protein OPV22_034583 [Ensete ventricosum]|uniref:Dolichyl-diphosphooligosaccharide--protein glycosyltransferase subunit DAD1 n=1 Tax=Ensete ventricosum TaxID=4639 RepID=A0AAV8PSU2_ENSVE|nr:hypothetical protein OPV22_034583 [Ensete ventricosum]